MAENDEQYRLVPSLGAIYTLSKEELVTKLSKVNLDTEGKVDELRARLSTFMKDNVFRKSPGKIPKDPEPEDKPDYEIKDDKASGVRNAKEKDMRSTGDAEKGDSTSTPLTTESPPESPNVGSKRTHNLPMHVPVHEFDRLTRDHSVRDWYYPTPGYVPPMFATGPYAVNQPAEVERLREESPHMFFSRPMVGREVNIMDTVRKWGLRFDGSGNAQEFMERLTELNESYLIRNQEVIRALPEILKGPALEWFRINRAKLGTWEIFEKAFLTYFLPTRYLNKLENELARKNQGPREKAKDFIRAYQYLVHQHPKMREDNHIDKIYDRLRPEYHMYIRRKDFETIEELAGLAEEFEFIKHETRTANPTTTRPTERPNPGTARNHREPAQMMDQYDRRTHCWNCKQRGHTKQNCRRPFRLFCSFCGEEGRMTKDCPCHQSFPQVSVMERNSVPSTSRGYQPMKRSYLQEFGTYSRNLDQDDLTKNHNKKTTHNIPPIPETINANVLGLPKVRAESYSSSEVSKSSQTCKRIHEKQPYQQPKEPTEIYAETTEFNTSRKLNEIPTVNHNNNNLQPTKLTERPATTPTCNFRGQLMSTDLYERNHHCWNCKQRGHTRQNCHGPFRTFCSYCGIDGRLSRECPCHQQTRVSIVKKETPNHYRTWTSHRQPENRNKFWEKVKKPKKEVPVPVPVPIEYSETKTNDNLYLNETWNDPRCFLDIKICNQLVNALVDTGATQTFIDLDTRNVLRKFKTPVRFQKGEIYLANGTPVNIGEHYEVILKIGSQEVQGEVTYLKELTHPILLGMDMLRRMNLSLKISNQEIALTNTTKPYKIKQIGAITGAPFTGKQQYKFSELADPDLQKSENVPKITHPIRLKSDQRFRIKRKQTNQMNARPEPPNQTEPNRYAKAPKRAKVPRYNMNVQQNRRASKETTPNDPFAGIQIPAHRHYNPQYRRQRLVFQTKWGPVLCTIRKPGLAILTYQEKMVSVKV